MLYLYDPKDALDKKLYDSKVRYYTNMCIKFTKGITHGQLYIRTVQ